MKPEKRKRRDNGEVDGKRPKPKEEDGPGTAVTDDQVEEFFAILRRIHVAANYLKKRDGMGRELTADGRLRLAALETDGVNKGEEKNCEGSAESYKGLDLNLEPPSKQALF